MQEWKSWDGTTATTVSYIKPDGSLFINTNANATGIYWKGTASDQSIRANGNDLNFSPRFDGIFGPSDNTGRFRPATDNTSDLGTSGQRWKILFASSATLNGLTLTSTTSPITLNGSVGTSGQVLTSAGAGATPTWTNGPVDGTTTTAAAGIGFMGLPQNSTTTGSYTIVAADAGKHIYASATRTVTINSNTNLALPIGTTLTFIAGSGATMTIAITSDTMYLAGTGTTGSRTLAPFGMATAVKITSTSWIISGNGLT